LAVGLEELLLANLLARRQLAAPDEIRIALEAEDRSPAKGDLYGRLAARNPGLARPDVREQALATVKRYVLAKSEAAFAARLRTSGALPPTQLEPLLALQQREQLAWTLGDRLVREGKLSPVRCSLLQKEASQELRTHETQLVARHRATRFAETLGQNIGSSPAVPVAPNLNMATSTEALAPFGIKPGMSASAAPGGDDDASEKTLLMAPPGVVPQPAPELDATVRLGVQPGLGGAAGPPSGKTTRPPGQPGASQSGKIPRQGPLAPGQVLGNKFTVVSELGRGNMGVVYRARAHDRGNAEVAVKVISLQGGPQSDAVQRFKREILTASLISHPNVCAFYGNGEANGLAFMAMELIEGETLTDLIVREAPLPQKRALDLIEQILVGVAECHAQNVIHRDLKPDNVRITRTSGKEVAKLVDFGIARLVNQPDVIAERVFVTMKGTLSGTPAYVAPELVLEPDLVDARCDLYACGVIFYELLAGKLPYAVAKKASIREILASTVDARAIPLAEAAPTNPVTVEVERFLSKLLEKDTEVRFQTAKDALAALKAASAPPKPPEKLRPRGFTARVVRAITRIFGRTE
jgi:hypothetical protein